MKTTKRIKWADTPEGKAHAEERVAYQRWLAEGGPTKTDTTLCFVCQEQPPTHTAKSKTGSFLVCGPCGQALVAENTKRNRIKQALARGQGGQMFTMTLGADLLPDRLTIEVIR